MGLGMGGDRLVPVIGCPYHIGFVVAERFASYDHDEFQRYTDSFDDGVRAKDNVKWIIARGDLVSPEQPIEKSTKVVWKTRPNGKKAGRIKLVFSSQTRPGVPATQLSRGHDGTFLCSFYLKDSLAR